MAESQLLPVVLGEAVTILLPYGCRETTKAPCIGADFACIPINNLP